MSCICGGGYIPGRFAPGAARAEREGELASAVEAFLRQAGPSTEATLRAWVAAREQLALALAVCSMLERGELEVTGGDPDDPMLALKAPRARQAR